MSDRDSSNTHEVIETLFRALNTKGPHREAAGFPVGRPAPTSSPM